MKQLIGIEYIEPDKVNIIITEGGIKISIEGRCVFSIIKAKEFSISDTRIKNAQ
ncbi:MAG TPA: hypothetical protein VF849_01455 [Blattabacteriaceae bacterium]